MFVEIKLRKVKLKKPWFIQLYKGHFAGLLRLSDLLKATNLKSGIGEFRGFESYLRRKFEELFAQQVKQLRQAYEVSLLLLFSSTNITTPHHAIERINHHLLLPFISSAQAEIGIIAKHQMINSSIVREMSLGITIISIPARIPIIKPTNNKKLITEPNDRSSK
jgi:hypothetical protein